MGLTGGEAEDGGGSKRFREHLESSSERGIWERERTDRVFKKQ